MDSIDLYFADLHAPYNHKDAIAFLRAVNLEYNPNRIFSLGDELDNHRLGFWPSDLTLYDASTELIKGRKVIREVAKMFPEVQCVESNHTSRVYRAGNKANIVDELLPSYLKLLDIEDCNWTWENEIHIKVKGKSTVLIHNAGTNVFLTSQRYGCSLVAGHIHTKQKIEYWQSPTGRSFGMQVGCLCDDSSPAYKYNIGQVMRPILGCAVIINGKPRLIEMNLTKSGKWDRRL